MDISIPFLFNFTGEKMRYVTIPLTALRSHPDLNPKITTNEDLFKYYQLDAKENFPTYYISFTELDKIGVNPNFNYRNPIGVYCYPLRYVYKNKRLNVRFAGKRPYIQVLKLNISENKILSNLNYNNQELSTDVDKLKKIFEVEKTHIKVIDRKRMFEEMKGYFDLSETRMNILHDRLLMYEDFDFDDVLLVAKVMSDSLQRIMLKKNSAISNIWCLSQVLASLLSKNFVIEWNVLLRKLGYDMVLDSGIGFIHTNEPAQAVFLISKAYKQVDTIANVETPTFNSNKNLNILKNAIKKNATGYRLVGNLELVDTEVEDGLLPDNLTITGNVIINNAKLKKLPNGLHIEGDLNISDTEIKILPKNLTVEGSLLTHNANISKIEEGLVVNGNLNLSQEANIKSLPEGTIVDGDLDLRNTGISKLPESLRHINGSADLGNTKIKKLPDSFYVKGDLNLFNLSITKLPKNLNVGGNLILAYTKITALPKDLVVGGTVGAESLNITSIPKGISVGGLNLGSTKVIKLPDNLYIKNDLNLRYTPIEILPKGLHVDGKLNLSLTNVKKLPDDLVVNGGIIGFSGED